jgi:Leucine-rich repeat (LRR) protein
VIAQPSLRVLDLSYNQISSISSLMLPTAGRLDQLYLTANPI